MSIIALMNYGVEWTTSLCNNLFNYDSYKTVIMYSNKKYNYFFIAFYYFLYTTVCNDIIKIFNESDNL